MMAAATLMLLVAFPAFLAAEEKESLAATMGAEDCLACHDDWGDARLLLLTASAHGTMACLDCHEGMSDYPHQVPEKGGHFAACSTCHADAFAGFEKSVHGPTHPATAKAFEHRCATCHGAVHKIQATASHNVPEHVCERCHGTKGTATRLGLPVQLWSTYEESVHGQKRALGQQEAPGCAACHGFHQVLRPDDPLAPTAPANRVATCNKCHEGSTERFALDFSHDPIDRDNRPMAFVVRFIYGVLILTTLLFFGILVPLELGSLVLRKVFKLKIVLPAEGPEQRFSKTQRFQHVLIILSFVALVVTGIPLMAAAADSDASVVKALGGVAQAGLIHRIAGVVLLLATAWHLLWLAWLRKTDRFEAKMLPALADFIEFKDYLLWVLLVREAPPHREAKYGWIEKLEYWAFAWGTMVMGVTGLLLWFPIFAAEWLPSGSLVVLQLIHGFEAILATMSVFIWHFYTVHLRPGTFPMSWTWLTGAPVREHR